MLSVKLKETWGPWQIVSSGYPLNESSMQPIRQSFCGCPVNEARSQASAYSRGELDRNASAHRYFVLLRRSRRPRALPQSRSGNMTIEKFTYLPAPLPARAAPRSEERREGKEC